MYHVFTRMPGESYRRLLTSLLLCLSDVFRAWLTPLIVYWLFLTVCVYLDHVLERYQSALIVSNLFPLDKKMWVKKTHT